MAEKKKQPAEAKKNTPSIKDTAGTYMAIATGALKDVPPERAGEIWQGTLVNAFGGPDKASAALASELKKRGGLIYKDKLVADGDFDAYAEFLLSKPDSQNLQLQMLDLGIADAYKSVIVKEKEKTGKAIKVKYDSKKAVEIAKSRADAGVNALSKKLKGDYKLGEDAANAIEAGLRAAYLDVFAKSADGLAKSEGAPMTHYQNAMTAEMAANQTVAKTAYALMEQYMTNSYMSVQEAGKTAAPAAKKAVKK